MLGLSVRGTMEDGGVEAIAGGLRSFGTIYN